MCTAQHSLNSAVGPYSLGYIHCLLASVGNSSVQAAGFASNRTIPTRSSDQIKSFAKKKMLYVLGFRITPYRKMTKINSNIFLNITIQVNVQRGFSQRGFFSSPTAAADSPSSWLLKFMTTIKCWTQPSLENGAWAGEHSVKMQGRGTGRGAWDGPKHSSQPDLSALFLLACCRWGQAQGHES